MTPANDVEAALHALSVFHEMDEVVEVRVISTSNRISVGYFNLDNGAAIRQAMLSINGDAEGVYFVLNKLDPALLARANNRIRVMKPPGQSEKSKYPAHEEDDKYSGLNIRSHGATRSWSIPIHEA